MISAKSISGIEDFDGMSGIAELRRQFKKIDKRKKTEENNNDKFIFYPDKADAKKRKQ
jgi:hypothetical protein